MNTDSNTGTLIVRVVGITQGTKDTQKLPVLMTGVPIRVVPGSEAQVPSTTQPGERHGYTGADGQIAFTDLPAGHYRIFAAGHGHGVELSPGCDLVKEIEPTIGFKLILPDQGSDYLSLDTAIPYGRNVRLQTTWTADDEQYFHLPPSGATTVAPGSAATVTSGLLARGISVDQLPAVHDRRRDYFLHAGEAGNVSILAYLGTLHGRFPGAKLHLPNRRRSRAPSTSACAGRHPASPMTCRSGSVFVRAPVRCHSIAILIS